MFTNPKRILLVVVLFTFSVSSSVNAGIKTFDQYSLRAIESSYSGKPFLLLVWSIDCLPCRQEFDMIQEIKTEYPDLNLTILATESLQQTPHLQTILAEHGLLEQDNWAFESSNSARLRYKLDPGWYGELPRAYFYNSQHQRFSVSGKLQKSQVILWLGKVSK